MVYDTPTRREKTEMKSIEPLVILSKLLGLRVFPLRLQETIGSVELKLLLPGVCPPPASPLASALLKNSPL